MLATDANLEETCARWRERGKKSSCFVFSLNGFTELLYPNKFAEYATESRPCNVGARVGKFSLSIRKAAWRANESRGVKMKKK